MIRWLSAFGVALAVSGAALPHLAEPAAADDARRLRGEAAALVQATESEDSARKRRELLEEARGKLLEIRECCPAEASRFQIYLGGERVSVSPESLRRPIAELRLADPDIAGLHEFAERALSPTAVDENGWTDLHYVALLNRPDLVEALLDTGADVSAKGSDGWTPLHLAAEKNAAEASAALIAGGADMNAKGSDGWTPLHLAVWWNNAPEAATALIAGGADMNAKNSNGRTPLHLAAEKNAPEAATALIASGADMNAKDSNGRTSLHLATGITLRKRQRR